MLLHSCTHVAPDPQTQTHHSPRCLAATSCRPPNSPPSPPPTKTHTHTRTRARARMHANTSPLLSRTPAHALLGSLHEIANPSWQAVTGSLGYVSLGIGVVIGCASAVALGRAGGAGRATAQLQLCRRHERGGGRGLGLEAPRAALQNASGVPASTRHTQPVMTSLLALSTAWCITCCLPAHARCCLAHHIHAASSWSSL